MTVDRVRVSPVTLVSGALVVAGFALTSVSWWSFGLVGLGAFGPGVLRELGILTDRDEFERAADHRAGYHAYLATGLVAALGVAWLRSGDRPVADPQELVTLFLALSWLTAFCSAQLERWGPRRAAAWVLTAFGGAWLVFNLLANTGPEWRGPGPLLMQSLLALPFFALGWLAPRHPRTAGGLLLAVSLGFLAFLGMPSSSLPIGLVTQGVTLVLFLGPLAASGIALLAVRDPRDDDGLDGGLEGA